MGSDGAPAARPGAEGGHYMGNADALAWSMEQDPGLRSTILAVAWLAGRPDAEMFAARLERATRLAPRFRQRPVASPGHLATPRWVDTEFDLGFHLRRMEAPTPRTRDTVLELVRTEAMESFDPTRPLWFLTLVEGLVDDEAALVMKVHHSLTDGIGGMQLAPLLFDTTPEAGPLEPVPVPAPDPAPGTAGLVCGAFLHNARRVAGTVRAGAGRVAPAASGVLLHPVRTTLDALATVGSVGRFVRPVADTLSPVMTGRSLERALGHLEVDLTDLKRAGATVGGTLNDAFVASVTGGMRRYHERHGESVEALRMTMPISLRRPGDPVGGNRITLERFTVPVGEPDPGARLRMTGWQCRAARHEEALPLSETIAGALNLLPPGVVGSMLKHVDFVASNVPGVAAPFFLTGAPVVGYVAFGPTTGAACNVTLFSYDGTCFLGCTMDTAAIPDPDVFVTCLREGFEEVLALGGAHHPVRPHRPDLGTERPR